MRVGDLDRDYSAFMPFAKLVVRWLVMEMYCSSCISSAYKALNSSLAKKKIGRVRIGEGHEAVDEVQKRRIEAGWDCLEYMRRYRKSVKPFRMSSLFDQQITSRSSQHNPNCTPIVNFLLIFSF